MPIGGMMVAIFAGWFLKPDLALDELSGIHLKVFNTWRFFIRLVAFLQLFPGCSSIYISIDFIANYMSQSFEKSQKFFAEPESNS